MSFWDDVGDFVGGAAEVAVDVATGDWGGVAETVLDYAADVGEGTWFGDLASAASDAAGTASWGNLVGAVADGVGGAVGGDVGRFISDAGGIAGSVADGDWEDVVTGALDVVGADLPAPLAGLAGAIAGDGWDGAVDWASGVASSGLAGLASSAFGAPAGSMLSTVAGALGEGGFDGVATLGLGQLDQLVPGAGGIMETVLGGASPQDILTGITDGDYGETLAAFGEQLGIDTSSLDGFVDALGSGNTSALVDQLGDEFSGFVDALGADSAQQLVDQFVSDGTLGDLLGNADSDAVMGLLGKVAESGGLEGVLGSLDADATTELVQKLLAGTTGSGSGVGDDAAPAGVGVGVGDGLDGSDDLTGSVSADDATSVDAMFDSGVDSGDLTVTSDGLGIDEPIGIDGGVGDDPILTDAAVELPPVEAPEPVVDDFSQTIAAADEIEESVDTMFDDLG